MKPFKISLAGALLILSAAVSAETLVYEREFSMIGESDNTLRVELYPDGRLVVERPMFMTRSGRHESKIPVRDYDRMRASFDNAYFDTDLLHNDVQRRAGEEEWIVTDAEFSRFAIVDGSREPLQQVTAVSLEAWASHFDDPRLQRLQQFEADWFALMDAQVSEVSE